MASCQDMSSMGSIGNSCDTLAMTEDGASHGPWMFWGRNIVCWMYLATNVVYLSWTLTALLSPLIPVLSRWSAHGKTRSYLMMKPIQAHQGARPDPDHQPGNPVEPLPDPPVVPILDNDDVDGKKKKMHPPSRQAMAWLIPKKYFWHFYACGLISLLTVSLLKIQLEAENKSASLALSSSWWVAVWAQSTTTTTTLQVLLTLHLVRRCAECWWVQQHAAGHSYMHAAAYVLGCAHYLLLPLCYIPLPAAALCRPLLTMSATIPQHSRFPYYNLLGWIHLMGKILVDGTLCLASRLAWCSLDTTAELVEAGAFPPSVPTHDSVYGGPNSSSSTSWSSPPTLEATLSQVGASVLSCLPRRLSDVLSSYLFNPTQQPPHYHRDLVSIPFLVQWLAPVLFCLWAQAQQYRHHVLLARLRQQQRPAPEGRVGAGIKRAAGGQVLAAHRSSPLPPRPVLLPVRPVAYGLPLGGWFQYVSCPHYLAEVLIYVSWAWLRPAAPGRRPVVVLIWVLVNLTLSARRTHDWYRQHVPHYDQLQRAAIFPFFL